MTIKMIKHNNLNCEYNGNVFKILKIQFKMQ